MKKKHERQGGFISITDLIPGTNSTFYWHDHLPRVLASRPPCDFLTHACCAPPRFSSDIYRYFLHVLCDISVYIRVRPGANFEAPGGILYHRGQGHWRHGQGQSNPKCRIIERLILGSELLGSRLLFSCPILIDIVLLDVIL